MGKYNSWTRGHDKALLNKVGGIEGAMKIIRGEVTISDATQTWRENDGVIYDIVTTNGKSGTEWAEHFEKKGTTMGSYFRSILLSDDFKPGASGIITEFAILKGMLWNDSDRTTKNIRAEALKRNLLTPNAELICLIRDKYTDEQIKAMGLLWIIDMHEPIKDSVGSLNLLGADADGANYQLSAYNDYDGRKWDRRSGFAFSVSQISAEFLEA